MKLKLKMVDGGGPIALHAEDGTILPNQVDVQLISKVDDFVKVVVTFAFDGEAVDFEQKR